MRWYTHRRAKNDREVDAGHQKNGNALSYASAALQDDRRSCWKQLSRKVLLFGTLSRFETTAI